MPDSTYTLTEVGAAAMDPPWRWEVTKARLPDGSYVRAISAGTDDNVVAVMDSDFTTEDADARFIALSRNVWDDLIAVVRAAEVRHAGESGNPLANALAALKAKVESQ